jgi:hypothetical protein
MRRFSYAVGSAGQGLAISVKANLGCAKVTPELKSGQLMKGYAV